MVKYSSAQLDQVFHSLADNTRRKILTRIAKNECTISELAAPFNMTLAAVSKHIRVLEAAGLLRRSRHGRIHRCRLDPKPLKDARDVIEFYQIFWTEQLNSLEKFIDNSKKSKKKR